MQANPLMEQDARLTPDAVAAAEKNPPPRTGPLNFLYNNAPTANNIVEALRPKIRPNNFARGGIVSLVRR